MPLPSMYFGAHDGLAQEKRQDDEDSRQDGQDPEKASKIRSNDCILFSSAQCLHTANRRLRTPGSHLAGRIR